MSNLENLNLFAVTMTADEFLASMVGKPVKKLQTEGSLGDDDSAEREEDLGRAPKRGRRGARRRRGEAGEKKEEREGFCSRGS